VLGQVNEFDVSGSMFDVMELRTLYLGYMAMVQSLEFRRKFFDVLNMVVKSLRVIFPAAALLRQIGFLSEDRHSRMF
jgi:hypothetical protein